MTIGQKLYARDLQFCTNKKGHAKAASLVQKYLDYDVTPAPACG
jgi:hypothetical protein